ncbi:hypothetical protein ABZ490_48395 [Streptomyces sp. NPDC005811]|uniref:hypothetical protein n=1 Tax=Streptomyces sp. NPDC005811 TaxID=3154565 RepID=UPI0033EC0C1C
MKREYGNPMRHRRPRLSKRALVRRKLLSRDKYVSGIGSGTELFKGTARPDTTSYAVTIG